MEVEREEEEGDDKEETAVEGKVDTESWSKDREDKEEEEEGGNKGLSCDLGISFHSRAAEKPREANKECIKEMIS